jgi:drug/metabolite transporter (DMT)-like permease
MTRPPSAPLPDPRATPAPPPARPVVVLALALLGISMAGPLVRLSHAHALAIAAWRLGLSLVLIGVALAITGQWRQLRQLTRRELGIALGAGTLLAFHFWSWNASVQLTTVAASVVLVNTQPVIVALLSVAWLHEPPTKRQWLGIGLAMLGAMGVALPDLITQGAGGGSRALLGDLLAVLGAITAAVYFTSGRRLRATLDLWPYVGLVYGACFVVLLVLCAIVGVPLAPQPPRELGIFLLLALGPMLLGHTGMNWALRYLPAYLVNLTILGEAVGATLIAALLPGIREIPSLATVLGGAVVLAGVLIAAPRRR